VTESISREEFYAANEKTVVSIKSYMDEKFESHEAFEAVKYESVEKMVGEHHLTLYGDPSDDAASPGLRIKVDRLRVGFKTVVASLVSMVTAAASYLGLK